VVANLAWSAVRGHKFVRTKKWMRAYLGIAVPQAFVDIKVANSAALKTPSWFESASQLAAAAVSEFIDTTSKTSKNLR
jgi:hypothetical protein